MKPNVFLGSNYVLEVTVILRLHHSDHLAAIHASLAQLPTPLEKSRGRFVVHVTMRVHIATTSPKLQRWTPETDCWT